MNPQAGAPALPYSVKQTASSAAAPPAPGPEASATSPFRGFADFLGNNEQVQDIQFDKAGNAWCRTWGHGCSLYSLDPQGNVRFARHFPQSDAGRLDVADERVLVFTQAGSRLYHLSLDNRPLLQARRRPESAQSGYASSVYCCRSFWA